MAWELRIRYKCLRPRETASRAAGKSCSGKAPGWGRLGPGRTPCAQAAMSCSISGRKAFSTQSPHGRRCPCPDSSHRPLGRPRQPAKQGGSNAPTMHPIGPQQTKKGRAPVRRTDGRLQITRRATNPMRAASPPSSDPPKDALRKPSSFAPFSTLAPLTGNQACHDPTRENAKNQASALWPGWSGGAASREQHLIDAKG